MRKILVIILAAIMIFATACSSEPAISNNAEGNSSTASQSPVTSGITVPDQIPDSEVKSDYIIDESETSAEIPEISSTAAVSDKEENELSIEITVNGRTFSATLYDNETAKEFKKRLPLTLDMSELNGNEKFYYLPNKLPTNSSRPSRINSGDIMLYGSDCLVIFYESFSTSYSYTPIGKIDDPAGLAAALGSGGVQVKFNNASNN